MMKQRQKSSYWQGDYKKLDKDSGSDDETELFLKNKSPKRDAIPSIEKNIEDGDTLQSLAIRYHCTIEDLKRLNNIHNDNEIFAKRTIKVPFRHFTMALAEVHVSGRSSPGESLPSTSHAEDVVSFNSKVTKNLLYISNGTKQTEVNEIIFNTNIAQKPVDRVNLDEITTEELEEEVSLLPKEDYPIAEAVVSKLNCSGADFDISWIFLVVCIVTVIFVFPLIYVFYIAEHLEKYHHPHNLIDLNKLNTSKNV